jgi:hypothetical protein
VQCPKCREKADGFNVTIPIGRRWNPEKKEMGMWAWGTTGMACIRCNNAIVSWPTSDSDISQEYVRSLVTSDIPGVLEVLFVSAPVFNSQCRLPSEETENAEVHAQ